MVRWREGLVIDTRMWWEERFRRAIGRWGVCSIAREAGCQIVIYVE